MKRPILIAVIGYIIGIIVGLYFEFSIVPLNILVVAILLICRKNKNKNLKLQKDNRAKGELKKLSFRIISFSFIKRYFRYLKIFLNSKTILVIIIFSSISNSIVVYQNKNYEKIYNTLSELENLEVTGIVISNKEEKQYYNKYKIQTRYKGMDLKFYISVNKNLDLEYGDKINILGQYTRPEIQRNYKGFDYSEYLKQLKIYGTIKCKNVKIIEKGQANVLFELSNKISNDIKQNINKVMREDSSILIGLVLGDKSDLDEQMQDNFRNASLSHILAVSGMHVTYVIISINLILKNIIGKRKTYFASICVLIFYMFITNFSPSITRAGVMGIILLLSKIIHTKNDIWTSLALSLLVILIYNPFLINNIGLQLSYGGVIGIIAFNKDVLKILENIKINNKLYKYRVRPKIQKFIDYIKNVISVSISVQIVIFPIIIYRLNTFNPYFLISNLLINFIIGPMVMLGFLLIIVSYFNLEISQIISPFLDFFIQILLHISKISELKYSKIYLPTPSILEILGYWFVIFILIQIYKLYSLKSLNKTQVRIRNIIALIKYKIRQNIKTFKQFLVIIVIIVLFIAFLPRNLKIYFIDVGQGDACLIVTSTRKTILIDGGGDMNFNVGKNTLVPYILDRGFTKIDIVIVSHFDNDHVRFYPIFIARNKSRKYYNRKAI